MATTEPAFDRIRDIVHARTGIVLHPRRRRRIEQRLAAILHTSGIDSLHELAGRLLDDPQCPLHDRIVEAATNHETSFFRDPRLFAALRRRIIPDLLNARQHNRSISIWCAGCSTGQEPYSVAMTLLDAVPRPAEWSLRILATDIAPDALRQAGAGHYVASQARRGLPAPLLDRHFTPRHDGWTVRPHLRDMVEFRALNLAGPWGDLPPMDLILLRNVLIYLDAATRRRVLTGVRTLLRPDGNLILGAAEALLGLGDGFARAQVDGFHIYRPAKTPAARQGVRGRA